MCGPEEFIFSSTGANRIARTLWGALRDRALSLPDDAELREEFLTLRLVETGPGVVKLQNPPGTHDDIVTAVGMVVADIIDKPTSAPGGIVMPGESVMLGKNDPALSVERQRAKAQMPLNAARSGKVHFDTVSRLEAARSHRKRNVT